MRFTRLLGAVFLGAEAAGRLNCSGQTTLAMCLRLEG